MIYVNFNHQHRYKQKSGEQGNKCYYTKLPKGKRPKVCVRPPPLIAPSHPLIKDPPKAINIFLKKLKDKNPLLRSTCIRRAWEQLSPNFSYLSL